MISPLSFYETLTAAGVNFVAGVPDSRLKEFSAFVEAALPRQGHMITVNEGTAIAVAAGVHLATGGIPLVYLQNSGLGNTINPLLSLADAEVYAIPMLLLIGWRGEPGVKDEPQHSKQGKVTPALLEAMQIPYAILDGDATAAEQKTLAMIAKARARSAPVALLVSKGAFAKSERLGLPDNRWVGLPSREESIALLTDILPPTATVISTTGHISRELYELRQRRSQDRSLDFLTVGCMGHASQIALGIARARPDNLVVCIDGDGAALMHMGGLASIGTSGATNYLHVLLNNGVHDSVGGQPTPGLDISFTGIATACGYRSVLGPVTEASKISDALTAALSGKGPRFIEIRVRPGARPDLGRPHEPPQKNKAALMHRLVTSSFDSKLPTSNV